jgi:N-acetylmuramoyl-L-alanine amidase
MSGPSNGPIRTIWVHCAATRPQWMEGQPLAAKVAEIRRWHTSPPLNWRDIGYHWIIDRDGQMAPGQPEAIRGIHVAKHNANALGVCLLGGHGSNATDNFLDHFTAAQDRALRQLIADIKARHPVTAIRGHNEVAAKACPGFNVASWLAARPAGIVRPVDAPVAPAPAAQPSSATVGFWARLAAIFGRKGA